MSNNQEAVPEQKSAGARTKSVGADPSVASPAFGLFLAVLFVYFLTRTHYNTFDAVSYANQIEHLYPRTHDAHWLFHPHHLLFNATAYVFWSAFYQTGYRGGALRVVQDLNIIWGAAGIALYYLILRKFLQRSRLLAMLLAVTLSVCFGYWISATDARVNMPSTTLLIAAFYVLCLHLKAPSYKFAVLVGFLAGLAVLYHESAGIFLPVGLIGLLLPGPDGSRNTKAKQFALVYVGVWAATVAVPYLAVAVIALHLHSWHEFRHWMTSYSELGWWWSFDVLHNIRLDGYALRRAAFVEPGGIPGTFSLAKGTPLGISLLYFATLAGWFAAACAVVGAVSLIKHKPYARIIPIVLVWSALYAVFFTFWSPGYFIFWVPALVPIGLMAALCFEHYRDKRGLRALNTVVGIWIVLIAAVNLESSIIPHLRQSSDPFQRIADNVAAHTKTGDIVVVMGAGNAAQCEVDIPYFADRDVVSLHGILTRQHNNAPNSIAIAQNEIDTAISQGHSVYALDEVWNDPVALMSLEHHHPGWNSGDITTLFQPYTMTHAWRGPHGVVWKVLPVAASSPTAVPAATSRL